MPSFTRKDIATKPPGRANTPSKPVSVKQSSWNLAIIKDEESSIVTAMDVADGPNRHKIIGSLKEAGGMFYNEELTLHQCVQLEDVDEIEGLLEDDSLKINKKSV